jgi:hypothetical protein
LLFFFSPFIYPFSLIFSPLSQIFFPFAFQSRRFPPSAFFWIFYREKEMGTKINRIRGDKEKIASPFISSSRGENEKENKKREKGNATWKKGT